MATRQIETWGQVHAIGDTRAPWNKGKKTRAVRSEEARKTEERFRERRRRDVEQALAMGVSLRFHSIADDYLHKRGDFARG